MGYLPGVSISLWAHEVSRSPWWGYLDGVIKRGSGSSPLVGEYKRSRKPPVAGISFWGQYRVR